MKPHTQLPRQSVRLDGDISSSQPRPNHPLVDYHFRTPQEEPQLRGSGTSQVEQATSAVAPKFSDLSKGVFGIDANQNNVAEAFVFAIVTAIALFPIAVLIYVMSQTVQ